VRAVSETQRSGIDGAHGPVRSVHVVGICGVAMGTLAGMLKERGVSVTGSDENVYPPMSDMLRSWGIPVHQGYDAGRIGSPDLVIIGNVISRGNPEAEAVLNRRIPYLSMAQAIQRFFLCEKETIAVCGTHGKTTTTCLLAHIFETAGRDPSFLVGGVSRNYNSNYRMGRGAHFIIEGDEYDSAFFEKVPKFIVYRPQHIVLTSLEFDHADIYRDLDEISLWFSRLINIIPSDGTIVYSKEYPILDMLCASSFSRVRSYGPTSADVAYRFLRYDGERAVITLESRDAGEFELRTTVSGSFNYSNIAAAASTALAFGIESAVIIEAVRTFRGVKRRQELIFRAPGIRIYEDFAHHPTAIAGIMREMRQRYPDYTLWALYEPRSATSRRNVFQRELPGAFVSADRVLIKRPPLMEKIPADDRIDIEAVIASLRAMNARADLFESGGAMADHVFDSIDAASKNVLVVMSNGGFDGIYQRLVQLASDRYGISDHDEKKIPDHLLV